MWVSSVIKFYLRLTSNSRVVDGLISVTNIGGLGLRWIEFLVRKSVQFGVNSIYLLIDMRIDSWGSEYSLAKLRNLVIKFIYLLKLNFFFSFMWTLKLQLVVLYHQTWVVTAWMTRRHVQATKHKLYIVTYSLSENNGKLFCKFGFKTV